MTTLGSLARRSMGTGALWMVGVSASSPMTVLVGGDTQVYATTGVLGAPLGFLALGAALMVMTVGYAGMTRHAKLGSSAPFYTTLALGLGVWAGPVGGLVALVGYTAIELACAGLLGATRAGLVGGAWWAWAAAAVALVGVLGALRVGIGAGVIRVLMLLEITVIALFVVGAMLHPAGGSISTVPMRPDHLLVPGVGGAAALLTACFIGFEAPGAFAEEARADRTASRAVFAGLGFLAVFYALAAWALAVAVGPDEVAAASRGDESLPLTIITRSLGPFGPMFGGLATFLLVTSALAAMLSFHGTRARYTFGMAREGVLPSVLSRTGTATRTGRDAPAAASLLHTTISAAALAAAVVGGADPLAMVFTWCAAVGAVSVLTLLLLSSASALVWFRNGGGAAEGRWQRTVGPALGIAVGCVVLGTAIYNLRSLLGTPAGSWLPAIVPGIVAATVVVGLIWAATIQTLRRQVYANIGQGRPHPLAYPDRRLEEVRLGGRR